MWCLRVPQGRISGLSECRTLTISWACEYERIRRLKGLSFGRTRKLLRAAAQQEERTRGTPIFSLRKTGYHFIMTGSAGSPRPSRPVSRYYWDRSLRATVRRKGSVSLLIGFGMPRQSRKRKGYATASRLRHPRSCLYRGYEYVCS